MPGISRSEGLFLAVLRKPANEDVELSLSAKDNTSKADRQKKQKKASAKKGAQQAKMPNIPIPLVDPARFTLRQIGDTYIAVPSRWLDIFDAANSSLRIMHAVVLTGTMQVSGIVEAQTGAFGWLIFKGHIPAIIAFLVFLVAGNAEANRGPFDLAEAESELTAGYHTEYSGMGFGFYYLAEYLNLFVVSAIATTVFLGGWAPFNIGVESVDNVLNFIPG